MTNSSNTTPKLLIFLDFERTIATSRRRHYAQYVEALERIRNKLGFDHEKLHPVSEESFLAQYGTIKNVGEMLSVDPSTFEGALVQRLLKQVHSEIIWEYDPEFMKLEELTPLANKGLETVARYAHGVIVSYTRQTQEDFANHLDKMTILSLGGLDKEDIHTVGSDGKKSREAKATAIRNIYSESIRIQQSLGGLPTLIGDSVNDMLTAQECNLHFLGVTETGKANKSDFESAIPQGYQDKVTLCTKFGDPESTSIIQNRATSFTQNQNKST